MRAWLLILGMIATPAVAADQFDLLCRGKQGAIRYRLDLTTGEFCRDQCATVQRLVSVTAGTITFVNRRPQFEGDLEILEMVNRTTGEWIRANSGRRGEFPTTWEGTCDLAEFSGFGLKERKF